MPPIFLNPAASERELLVQLLQLVDANQTELLQRILPMAIDLSALTSNMTALQGAVTALKPLLDSSVDLGTKAVAAIESLSQQIAALAPTQAAIDALAASAASTVADLQADAAEVTAGNATVQAELDKINPPPPPPAP